MKLLIASDIHGSHLFASLLRRKILSEKPDKVVLLGDILYHGPRNDLPEDYDPKKVIEDLSGLPIIAVKGNCDSEVDDMVLPFPVSADSAFTIDKGLTLYFCHGHREVIKPNPGDIVFSGHTHVPRNIIIHGVLQVNPGSVSLPKERSHHGYIIYEDGKIKFYDLISGQEVSV